MKIPERELECLKLVCLGYASKEIAQKMRISIKTVEKHRGTLFWRFAVNTPIALLRACLRKQIITVEEFLSHNVGENSFHKTPQGKK